MTIVTIAFLIREVRVYAALRTNDYGWTQVSAMTDDHIKEVIRDNNCATIQEAISAMQDVSTAFNED